ncbi:MAG: D-glycerate dehydrogenase [Planctomycetota bacterium]
MNTDNPNVYVTRILPEKAINLLKKTCNVEINPDDRMLARKELLQKVKGKDAVLCLLTDKIDDEVFAAAGPKCRIFANYAVGYNNVDVQAATKRKIVVTNTPGVLTDATADLAWTLLFAVSRRVVEADRFTRQGKFTGWEPMMFLGRDITGKTLGVIGAGRIGANFAKKAVGFNMKILYSDLAPNKDFEKDTGAMLVKRDELLQRSDFVSIHVPLMPETEHLIGERELSLMKKTAVLINTSRGPVMDEKALVKALRTKTIWGVGLDVYENEPAIEPGLAELENVVILPHIASATIETRTNMGLIAVKNIIAVMNNQMPPNCVNPEVFNAK